MNEAYRVPARKIDPTKGLTLPDGTLNDNDRIEIGPTPLAYAEWAAAGLTLPDLPAMRAFRLGRIVDRLIGAGAVSPKAGGDRRVITSEQGYALHAAWPDPFTGTTSVSFELPEETVISVAVYDIAGREVRRLADGRCPGGTSTLVFDAAGLPAGTYLLRLTTGSVSKTRTLRVLR